VGCFPAIGSNVSGPRLSGHIIDNPASLDAGCWRKTAQAEVRATKSKTPARMLALRETVKSLEVM